MVVDVELDGPGEQRMALKSLPPIVKLLEQAEIPAAYLIWRRALSHRVGAMLRIDPAPSDPADESARSTSVLAKVRSKPTCRNACTLCDRTQVAQAHSTASGTATRSRGCYSAGLRGLV